MSTSRPWSGHSPENWMLSGVTAGLIAALFLAGCGGPDKTSPPQQVRALRNVAVTNAFLEYCAKSLVDSTVQVSFPLAGEGDPADWEPNVEALKEFQQADLVFLNGASYEKWIASVSLPSSRIRRTANGFRNQWIEVEGIVHSHGPGGEHSHAGTAYTTWIDFNQARLQALEMKQALIEAGLEERGLEERFQKLDADLKRLDLDMKNVAAKISDQAFVVSHPVYQYWSRRYGLNTRSVHWEPDLEPAEVEQDELRKLVAEFPAGHMIWEADPSDRNRELASQQGLVSVVFNPCGKRPQGRTWLEAMQQNIKNLETLVPLANK